MKPKKYKEILKKVTKKHNLDSDLVEDSVEFFYKRVRRVLVNLENTSVLLPKLGTFKLRENKMKSLIETKEGLVKKLNPHEFNKYDSYRKHSADLEKLYKVKSKFDELDKQRKEFFKGKDSKY